MKNRKILHVLITLILLVSTSFVHFFSSTPEVHAQSTSLSLITPYYGEVGVRSFFDHSSPNYGINNYFVRYDGWAWTGSVGIDTCIGYTNCYDGHNGLDFNLVYDRVLASANGTVWYADYANNSCHYCSYGLQIKIKHIVNGQIYSTRYAHLTTLAVEFGQTIKAGQIIGTSGSTGASTGPHLHFDVSICVNDICESDVDFRAIDPFGWLPDPEAPVQDDPWALAQNSYGADSWCMWGDGQFVDVCDPIRPSHPVAEPFYGSVVIVDDTTDNTMGFYKGYNGNGGITCIGIDPECPEWWETNNTGYGEHVYRTIMNGLDGNYSLEDNWARWKPQSILPGDYEIFVNFPSNLGFDNNTFTWQAHFSVVDTTFYPAMKIVDQHIDTGQNYNPRDKWLSLGIYNLNVNSSIYLLDDGEGPNNHCPTGAFINGYYWCRVAADVVAFLPIIHQVFLPIIID